jgi:hypothetical protein
MIIHKMNMRRLASVDFSLATGHESVVFSNNLARLKVRFVPVIVRTQLECLRLHSEDLHFKRLRLLMRSKVLTFSGTL